MFTCKNCSKSFFPTHNAAKYVTPTFCSKSCKSVDQMQGYRTKDELISDICDLIKSEGTYLTKSDITTKLKVSSKTLNKFRISILKLNNLCDMKKPASVFELKVFEVLKQIYENYKIDSQVTFDDLVSPKNWKLRFDFAVKSLKIIIEADGNQHNDSSHYMSTDYTVECDRLKESWCLLNGYKLIRIPYTRKVTFEYVNKYVNLSATTQL